jgi:hypothetical protein
VRNVYGNFIVKATGRNSADRPRPTCEDNINMHLKEDGGMIWTHFLA